MLGLRAPLELLHCHGFAGLQGGMQDDRRPRRYTVVKHFIQCKGSQGESWRVVTRCGEHVGRSVDTSGQ